MGEIAEELPPAAQNNNLNLELRSGIDIMAISSETTTVRCRWVGCKQWFGHLELLASHVTRVHATSGKGGLFYCGWEGCTRGDRGFNARYKMLVHVRTHTNEKPHHCFKCDKSFSRAENLKIHARSHTGERPYTCPVPGCGKAYSNSSDRFKHTRTHSVDKPYVCKVPGCPKRYTDPSSLRKHVKTYRHFPLETAIFDKEISKQVNNHNSEDDESQSSSDKGNNNLASISKAAAPKILKRDCNGALKLGCEDQEAKVCANEQCCSPTARPKSPVLCSRSCCIGTEVPSLYHGTQFLWNGHNAHYNLLHSWIDADLTLLSRSWASGLSLWSHPIMQPSTCDQQNNGLVSNPEVSSYSFDSAKYNRSELSTKDTDAQDIPLDLTVHRTSV